MKAYNLGDLIRSRNALSALARDLTDHEPDPWMLDELAGIVAEALITNIVPLVPSHKF